MWLGFPADQDALTQLTLLEIITSNSPISILFLDTVWEMFKNPFATIFKKGRDIRRSLAKLSQTLDTFEKQFPSHPFATSDSLCYRKLQHLSDLIQKWMESAGVDSNAAEIASRFFNCMKCT
jgi:hypothetical protein